MLQDAYSLCCHLGVSYFYKNKNKNENNRLNYVVFVSAFMQDKHASTFINIITTITNIIGCTAFSVTGVEGFIQI